MFVAPIIGYMPIIDPKQNRINIGYCPVIHFKRKSVIKIVNTSLETVLVLQV